MCATALSTLFANPDDISEHVAFQINERLKENCGSVETQGMEYMPVAYDYNFATQFNTMVKPNLSKTCKWVPWFGPIGTTAHIYSFGESPGYANMELEISTTFDWRFFTNKIERNKRYFTSFERFPEKMDNIKPLVELLKLIDEYNICAGCEDSERFDVLEKVGKDGLYKRKDGKNAVVKDRTFRSSNCNIFVPKGSSECPECNRSSTCGLSYLEGKMRMRRQRKRDALTTKHGMNFYKLHENQRRQ